MSKALVVCDPWSADATARAVGAAKKLCDSVDVLDLGLSSAEDAAPFLAEYVRDGGYTYLLSAATAHGRDVLPRVAALLSAPFIPGVLRILSPHTFTRSAHAGAVLETWECAARPLILTICPHAFEGVEVYSVSHQTPPSTGLCEVIESVRGQGVDLSSARVVVAGGQALGGAQNFKIIERLAESLGAAPAATRAAVDAGYAPNAWQVGQTGVSVAPDLYIGIGVSGAVQHTCGMREAKIIVAINTDPLAPLCQMADYILEHDLFEAMPRLTNSVQK